MTSLTCTSCGHVGWPSFVPNDKYKMIAKCSKCQHLESTLGPSDFAVGVAAVQIEGANEADGWAGKRKLIVDPGTSHLDPVRRPAAPAPSPQTSPPHPAAQSSFTPPAPMAHGDVLSWIEERALWLSAEDARIAGAVAELEAKQAGVRAEKKQLEKMLRSARRGPRVEPYVMRDN